MKRKLQIILLHFFFIIVVTDVYAEHANKIKPVDISSIHANSTITHLITYTSEFFSDTIPEQLLNPKSKQYLKSVKKDFINFGFARKSYWFQFAICNTDSIAHEKILRINYPLLNVVDFYVFNKNNHRIKTVKTGDYRPFDSREIENRNFLFKIKVAPNDTLRVLLFVNNHGETLRLPIDILSFDELLHKENENSILDAILYGLIGFVLFFHFFLSIIVKEAIYLYYTLYVGLLSFFLLGIDGLSYMYFYPNMPWMANHIPIISVGLANFFLLYFSATFLNLKNSHKKWYNYVKILSALSLLFCVMAFLPGKVFITSVKGVNILSGVNIISLIIISIQMIHRKFVPAYYFLFSFFPFMGGVVFYILRNLGKMPDNIYTVYGLKTGFAGALLMLSVAIIIRFRKMKEEALQNLEFIVAERTEEIKAQHEEIKSQNEEIIAQSEELAKANDELQKLSIVASSTDNGVTIFDHEQNIEFQNSGFRKLYGYNYFEKLAHNERDLMQLYKNVNMQGILNECLNEKKSIIFENQIKGPDQKDIFIQTTLTPIFHSNGSLKKIITIDSDVTVIKNAEKEISSKNIQILDSIRYAQNIQAAILPPQSIFDQFFSDHFIIYKPKDIVSGDFYWLEKSNDRIILAMVDCTGHGVPGAFMSFLGYDFLNHIVIEEGITRPHLILNRLNDLIIDTLRKKHTQQWQIKDSMDAFIISINPEEKLLEFAGAQSYALFLSGNKAPIKTQIYDAGEKYLHIFKGDRHQLGENFSSGFQSIQSQRLQISSGDKFYLLSDGYTDQFGGEKNRKFMRKNFRQIIIEHDDKTLSQQKTVFEEKFYRWKGNNEQVDDVTVIGIEL